MRLTCILVISAYVILTSAQALHAQNSALLFKRDALIIQRQPIVMLPWQSQKDAQEQLPLTISIELRDSDLYYHQKDWFNLQALSNKSGVLFMFETDRLATIKPANQFSALDILLIDSEGIIRQIIPSIVLSSLKKEIIPKDETRGLLFLKGGASKELTIKPGDIVQHHMFSKDPAVVTTSSDTIIPVKSPVRKILIMEDKPRNKTITSPTATTTMTEGGVVVKTTTVKKR